MKIVTVIGARPQFIKAAAISRAISNSFSDKIEEVIVHTGQHYDEKMSQVFFEELNIPKEKYNLAIGSGSHAVQTANMMVEIEKVVLAEKPDAILLYGDTNSTLAACLVAVKLHLHVIHVEGGVRSYNKEFPEEVNRIICDNMSSLIFVPSDAGMDSLEKEGFNVTEKTTGKVNASNALVFRCGDIMYDNTLFFIQENKKQSVSVFEKYDIPSENFILTTMHRPSNVDQIETIDSILRALNTVAEKHGKTIVLPLHPRTKKIIEEDESLRKLTDNEQVKIIPPASFLEMIDLEKNADLVVTDSGGVQKEAYFVEKPCLIMLSETPWTELVESGNAKLVGNDYQLIVDGADDFLNQSSQLNFPSLYGDGMASEFICQEIVNLLK
ncbi:MAG TPA: UDP-N-acetylglucosamine 2-epimerase (non-hydrolyzing) [Crocinitomicaceae bacterium]|nr:UDP-N-acetylglucosamine 2-epimerase (non-hydrolyzing) [Crocinitomicaceae bacterium]